MREALQGLTTRGRCFLAAGSASVLCGVVVGQRDLVRLGVLLLVLPVVAALALMRTRYRLACARVVDPARVQAGEPGRVALRLHNVSRVPSGILLVEDTLPYPLGTRPRFVLSRLEPQGSRDLTYGLRSDMRGRYPIGPLSVRLADPFGLCELGRSFNVIDTLVVTPVVWPLPAVRISGGFSGHGESRARSLAASGDDDVGTRTYRQGDDLRRIHWRTTARTGELMVRREEQPWQASAVLMLDNRVTAHRGDGPGSSFEYACSAAASIGVHLLRSGYTLRLGPGLVDPRLSGLDIPADSAALLDALAVASLVRAPLVPPVDSWRGGAALFIAVLGALSIEDAERLAHAAYATSGNLAVLLDTATWTTLAPRARLQADERQEAVAAILRTAGWRVVRATHGAALAELWPRLARPSSLDRAALAGSVTEGVS